MKAQPLLSDIWCAWRMLCAHENVRAAVRSAPLPIVRTSIEDCLAAVSAADVQFDAEQRAIDDLHGERMVVPLQQV